MEPCFEEPIEAPAPHNPRTVSRWPTGTGLGGNGRVGWKTTDTPQERNKKFYDAVHKVLVPHIWDEFSEEEFKVDQLTGGMTNVVFCCWWTAPGKAPSPALLRVYGDGSDAFFSREAELAIFRRMADESLGPNLLAEFEDGRIEEFLVARTLSAADMHLPGPSGRIANAVANMHRQLTPLFCDDEDSHRFVFGRMDSWLEGTLKLYAGEETVSGMQIDSLTTMMEAAKERLRNTPSIPVAIHGDLQHGNIMEQEVTRGKQISVGDLAQLEQAESSYSGFPRSLSHAGSYDGNKPLGMTISESAGMAGSASNPSLHSHDSDDENKTPMS